MIEYMKFVVRFDDTIIPRCPFFELGNNASVNGLIAQIIKCVGQLHRIRKSLAAITAFHAVGRTRRNMNSKSVLDLRQQLAAIRGEFGGNSLVQDWHAIDRLRRRRRYRRQVSRGPAASANTCRPAGDRNGSFISELTRTRIPPELYFLLEIVRPRFYI
jgi:hypothetical protein